MFKSPSWGTFCEAHALIYSAFELLLCSIQGVILARSCRSHTQGFNRYVSFLSLFFLVTVINAGSLLRVRLSCGITLTPPRTSLTACLLCHVSGFVPINKFCGCLLCLFIYLLRLEHVPQVKQFLRCSAEVTTVTNKGLVSGVSHFIKHVYKAAFK